MKKIRLWIVCILVFGAAMIFIGKKEVINAYFSTVKLQFLTSYTSKHYLYDFEEQTGIEGIYSGYLQGLSNSATYYLNEDDLKAARARMKGNYYGTGLSLIWNLDGHSMIVTDIVKHSPAEREGIQVGDLITRVDGIKVLPSNEKDILEKTFSNSSEPIHFTIENEEGSKEITLIPEEVSVEDIALEIIDEVMYIKLNTIKEGTSIRLKQRIDENFITSYKGIILDVRGLSTDNLEEVCKISDLFLDRGIAFKEKIKGEDINTFTTEDEAYDMEMAILMNGTTLGGAEALVLALKERATLYGSDTGGLLYTKQIISFEDGTGMSVASGKICDRYGKQLSEEGIEPDERLYLNEKEQINKLVNGYITIDEDSYLASVLEKFQ